MLDFGGDKSNDYQFEFEASVAHRLSR
ncbi:hypothetical protein [Paraburkholderia sp. BCC1884]